MKSLNFHFGKSGFTEVVSFSYSYQIFLSFYASFITVNVPIDPQKYNNIKHTNSCNHFVAKKLKKYSTYLAAIRAAIQQVKKETIREMSSPAAPPIIADSAVSNKMCW